MILQEKENRARKKDPRKRHAEKKTKVKAGDQMSEVITQSSRKRKEKREVYV